MRYLFFCLTALPAMGGTQLLGEEPRSGSDVERMRSLAQQTDVWLVSTDGVETTREATFAAGVPIQRPTAERLRRDVVDVDGPRRAARRRSED